MEFVDLEFYLTSRIVIFIFSGGFDFNAQTLNCISLTCIISVEN